MLNLLGDSRATAMFELAREQLALQGQWPLQGIDCYEQATAASSSADQRRKLLEEAMEVFARLGMTYWHERASLAATSAATGTTVLPVTNSIDSRREQEELRLIARGLPDRQIAEELFISERTVHAHVRNMLQKTDCDNRIQLANWARMSHLFDRDLPNMSPTVN
jgi:DNA-binding NarL/FixJ family response regulator